MTEEKRKEKEVLMELIRVSAEIVAGCYEQRGEEEVKRIIKEWDE